MPLVLTALMAGEYVLGYLLGRPAPGRRQTLNNLAVTVAHKLYGLAFAIAPFFGYAAIQQRIGLWDWSPAQPLHWIAAWLILDFTMYWRHRAAHRIAALWAIHTVHHQSEEYNTTVAARASMFQDTVIVVMPLAVLGVPLSMGMTVFAGISMVTFFSHTELVGTLCGLDGILVTPSVHRVHHARNAGYLDKNYGASLVIWDRLFGTHAAETEPVEYGTLDGLRTYDPLVNNLSPWTKLFAKARSAPTFKRAILTFVMSPAWDPTTASPETVERPPQRAPFRRPTPIQFAIAGTFLALGAGMALVLALDNYNLPASGVALTVLFGLAIVGISGAVLDHGQLPWHRRSLH